MRTWPFLITGGLLGAGHPLASRCHLRLLGAEGVTNALALDSVGMNASGCVDQRWLVYSSRSPEVQGGGIW